MTKLYKVRQYTLFYTSFQIFTYMYVYQYVQHWFYSYHQNTIEEEINKQYMNILYCLVRYDTCVISWTITRTWICVISDARQDYEHAENFWKRGTILLRVVVGGTIAAGLKKPTCFLQLYYVCVCDIKLSLWKEWGN